MPLVLRLPDSGAAEGIFKHGIPWLAASLFVAFLVTFFLFVSRDSRNAGQMNHVNRDARLSMMLWAAGLGLMFSHLLALILHTRFTGFPSFLSTLTGFLNSGPGIPGIRGLSYSGAYVGVLIGSWVWTSRNSINFLSTIDSWSETVLSAHAIISLGLFMNNEGWGQISRGPLSIIFPEAPLVPVNNPFSQVVMQHFNLVQQSEILLINLPRHPVFLYELVATGIVCVAILIVRRITSQASGSRSIIPREGLIFSIYSMSYGLLNLLIGLTRSTAPESVALGLKVLTEPGETASNWIKILLPGTLVFITGLMFLIFSIHTRNQRPRFTTFE